MQHIPLVVHFFQNDGFKSPLVYLPISVVDSRVGLRINNHPGNIAFNGSYGVVEIQIKLE